MPFKILFFALLATAIGQSVVLTTLPSLGRETGLSEFQVSVIMSSSACIFALGTTVWSRVAKRRGHRRLLMLGLTGYTLGTLLFAGVWTLGLNGYFAGTALFLALLLARSLQSSVMSATPPSAVGYTIAISPASARVKSISKVTSANNLGQILGPTFAGALVGFGLLTPLYAVVLLTVVALLLVYRKLPVSPPAPHTSERDRHHQVRNASLRPLTSLLISLCASVFCAMAMLQQTLGFFLIDVYNASTVQAAQGVGLAMMLSAVSSLGIQLVVVQRTHMAPEKLIQLAMPLLCSAYLLMYFHQALWGLYIAMVLMGLAMGMAYPSIAAAATSRCHPDRQATVTGMITATPAMGYIIGPPVAALFYGFDERYPFLVAAMMVLFFTLLASLKLQAFRSA